MRSVTYGARLRLGSNPEYGVTASGVSVPAAMASVTGDVTKVRPSRPVTNAHTIAKRVPTVPLPVLLLPWWQGIGGGNGLAMASFRHIRYPVLFARGTLVASPCV